VNNLPYYENPPIVEVACSTMFSPKALLTAHLGLLWQRFQPDYPFCDDVAPLAPVFEYFEGQQTLQAQINLSNVPPLPRVWFINKDQNGLIQVQQDRFIYNWRLIRPEDDYPRYGNIINSFQTYFEQFNSFLQEVQLEAIVSNQYELTYVNYIPEGDEWQTLEDIGNIFPDFAFRSNTERFIAKRSEINWKTVFDIPELLGRLHVSIRNGIRDDKKKVIILELTVRGGLGVTQLEWFNMAHDWIVRAFSELTDNKVQEKIWKIRK